jgi:hypothetical protein
VNYLCPSPLPASFVSPEFSVLCDAYGPFTMFVKSREKEFKRRAVK